MPFPYALPPWYLRHKRLLESGDPSADEFNSGARAYHLRAILHDWPDDKCQQILKHIVIAMRPGYSKLLLSESILPDRGARAFPAALDVQMMALHAGRERTEGQWRSLLASVGLCVIGVWQKVVGGEGVIEAVIEG